MRNKIRYIPAIKFAHYTDAPTGRIVSIGADGRMLTARTIEHLEVKVYYSRMFREAIEKRLKREKAND